MSHSPNQTEKISLIMSTLADWYAGKPQPIFEPGKTYIKVAQANNNLLDYIYMFKAILDDHWTEGGQWTTLAQDALSEVTKKDYVSLCNSGSSANLLAFSALNERYKFDTIITTAVNFPTTITPAIQANKKIVFLDTDPSTLAPAYSQLDEYIQEHPHANICVILAHTLGFPFSEEEILNDCLSSNCCFLFDECDALGAEIDGNPVGHLADLSTCSFYPAHHVSAIEGGAVFSGSKELTRLVESYRNWGRDCYCNPNEDNTCGQRFNGKWGDLPRGFDHKYITSRIGYNLKMTEIQAALLYSQLQGIEAIRDGRRMNFNNLRVGLSDLEEYFSFVKIDAGAIPSPFGFVLTCKPPINRLKLIRYLENKMIGTRLIFGTNLALQPAFVPYVKSGQIQCPFDLSGAYNITENSFWISCNQNLTSEMVSYMIEILHQAVKEVV
jgi:CDP-4-dehydro-6-deoxyglucose reductase, E1